MSPLRCNMGGSCFILFLLIFLNLIVWLITGSLYAFYFALGCLLLPLISLWLSQRAIRSFEIQPHGTFQLIQGGTGQLALSGRCFGAIPPFQGKIQMVHSYSGEIKWYDPDAGIPSGRVGCWECRIRKAKVFDYLGFVGFSVKSEDTFWVYILPVPRAIENLPDFHTPPVQIWVPSAGQDLPEEYELRGFRPGDNPRRMHWKLSAKTGTLILRQGLQPHAVPLTVSLQLYGNSKLLSLRLGQLLWLGEYLIQEQIPFQLLIFHRQGQYSLDVIDRETFQRGLRNTLQLKPMVSPCKRDSQMLWEYSLSGLEEHGDD